MSVLFVTSFTPQLFEASGWNLVRTFLDTKTEGALLICHEGFSNADQFRRSRLRTYDLKRAALLKDWLAANQDIIPERYGGSAGGCSCPDPEKPFGRHEARCPNSWFNQNAARWFRKIVSLDYAMRLPGYTCIVWLDCDCYIKAAISEPHVKRWFGSSAVFYLKSPRRKVIESGVVGVRGNAAGRKFVEATVDRYRSGVFRRDLRWDDGYQLQLALRKHPEIPSVDLANDALGRADSGHVVPCSPLGRYIRHLKGLNAVKLGYI